MRITNKTLVDDFINNLHNNLGNMQKYQNQLSSGLEISKPSDDPFKVARALELNTDIAANTRYSTNIDEGTGWLTTTDSALGQMGDAMQRIRELTVQAGDATNGPDEMNAISGELTQLKGELMQVGNTAYDGRYIFGGDATTNPPFSQDANGNIFYNGSSNGLIKEYAQGISMDIGTKGEDFSEIFAGNTAVVKSDPKSKDATLSSPNTFSPTSAFSLNLSVTFNQGQASSVASTGIPANYTIPPSITQSGNNSIIHLVDLSNSGNNLDITIPNSVENQSPTTYSTSIKPNIVDQILTQVKNNQNPSALLTQFDADNSNLLDLRSNTGAMENRLSAMKSKNDDDNYNLTQLLSNTEDIDIAEKTMQYNEMETVYKAALQTGASVLQVSLLDFLK